MHLENLERQTRKPNPDLAPLECPDFVLHVWGWFCDLSRARSGGMGPNPIGYAEIEAWARLTGRRPTSFETECLRMLDDLFLSAREKPASKGSAT